MLATSKQLTLLARIFHELLAATTDMAVLPGVLGCRPLRRTVQVRLGTNTLRLPSGPPIFVVSRQQFMKYPGWKKPREEDFMLPNRWPVIMFLGVLLNISVSGNKAAQAYILPPEQIIEYVSKQTARVYNFHFVVSAESPDPELPKTMMRREMVIYAARPDFLRQEMVGEAGSDITLASSGRRLSVTDGHLLAEPPRHEDIFAILLHANSPQTLETLLASEQVDLSQAHISRFDKRIAYVIGGPPGEAK